MDYSFSSFTAPSPTPSSWKILSNIKDWLNQSEIFRAVGLDISLRRLKWITGISEYTYTYLQASAIVKSRVFNQIKKQVWNPNYARSIYEINYSDAVFRGLG